MRPLAIVFLAAALAGCAAGFEVPQAGHVFSFPRDYGSHEGFRIEWWYVTGHLFAGPRRFGFQATFFRFAGGAPGHPDVPGFSERELHLAHMALTDVAGGKFLHEERLNRDGWDAHASPGTLDLANGEWTLRLVSEHPVILALHGAVQAEARFDLRLAAAKPLVLFGENGVSRKGSDPSAASYYLTFSRLAADGTLAEGGAPVAVQGEAWMDHEISSSQLGAGQVGWDWTCVQFRGEPWELMMYRMRRADGSADPASILQWVSPEGKAVTEPFQWETVSSWKSPRSGATYPSRVRLSTRHPGTGAAVTLELVPVLPDQELSNALGGGPYWEGACSVRDGKGRDLGSAYLELTGYAKPLHL